MSGHSILQMPGADWRSRAARRVLTRARLVPSHDVCRYQAKHMPRPTYDLERNEPRFSLSTILVLAFALGATAVRSVSRALARLDMHRI
jgi:hypothetical protein